MAPSLPATDREGRHALPGSGPPLPIQRQVRHTVDMTGEQILAEWEKQYGKLPLERRDRFLTAGGYVERLSRLEDDVVYEAIENRRRLDEIESFATGAPQRRATNPGTAPLQISEKHPSEYGPVTVRRPGRPETVIDQGPCSTCGMRLTPEGRCACS